MPSYRHIIPGTKYNQLTFIKELPAAEGQHNLRVECLCDCGTTVIIPKVNFSAKRTKSCGCLQKINAVIAGKKNCKKPGEAALTQIYNGYIANARYRKLEFSLSKNVFRKIASQNCDYCGAVPTNRNSNFPSGPCLVNGIDRIDNQKGYIAENCIAACKFCNWTKSNYTKEEFLNHVEKIHKYQLTKSSNLACQAGRSNPSLRHSSSASEVRCS
jgi:hypothetical protein